MNWANGVAWLSAWRDRQGDSRSSEPDRADMGTAFGLDASFGPVDEPPPMARGAVAEPSSLPWEHRLTRRSSL
jgi:hypothetical protein